jgi:regulator of sirC expression with transglutaminase-like and TPR domain
MSFPTLTPLEYFGALVAEDEAFALTEAAASIALDEQPGVDVQGVLSDIDALAARLKARLPADAGTLQRLRLLNRYFFRELGFEGNVNDYYATVNSTRRGIPISLAVIYLEIAQQIGLAARGVAFPGHFLLKVRMPQGEVIIDPFSGQSLSREELEDRLAPYKRRQGLVGDFDVPLGLFLQSASPREIIGRMLRNLKEIHRSGADWARALAVQERLVLLLPDDAEELRDRGLAHAELGDRLAAAQDLEHYVARVPKAEDSPAIAERAALLRAAGRPRLH